MVKSFINDKWISTQVDSGAESNIIDAGLLKELKSVNRNIKLSNKPGKLVCANGFLMTIQGIRTIDIVIRTKKRWWIL